MLSTDALAVHHRPRNTRLGWDTAPGALQDHDRNLGLIDHAYRELVVDLQRTHFATSTRQRSLAVPVWASAERRRAVHLADVAVEAHGRVAEAQASLCDELSALSGHALAQRIARSSNRLQEMLWWVPSWRRDHIFKHPRRSRPLIADIVEELELPHVVFAALTMSWNVAEREVEEFVELGCDVTALEEEHLRRAPESVSAIYAVAAIVLAVGRWPHHEETALRILETNLPWRKVPAAVRSDARGRRWREVPLAEQSDGPDRLRDGAQDLRRYLLELLRALGARPPEELLGSLYDDDPGLRYVPNHAWRDFLNQQDRDAQDALGLRKAEGTEEAGSPPIDGVEAADEIAADFSRRSEARPFEPSLPSEFIRALGDGDELTERAADDTARLVELRMKHTPTEKRILRAILGDPNGTDVAIAETAGCSREYVNRYRRRLRLAVKRLMR